MAHIDDVGRVSVSYKKDRSAGVEGAYHYPKFTVQNNEDRPIKVEIGLKLLRKGSVFERGVITSPVADPGESAVVFPENGAPKRGEVRLTSITVLAAENGEWTPLGSNEYDDQTLMKRACYVATHAFGDEDHPEVEKLRRFRDVVLRRSRTGRWLTRRYYAHQASVTHLLGESAVLRQGLRYLLRAFNRAARGLVSGLSSDRTQR
jgi:hypothetical protein